MTIWEEWVDTAVGTVESTQPKYFKCSLEAAAAAILSEATRTEVAEEEDNNPTSSQKWEGAEAIPSNLNFNEETHLKRRV